MSNNIWTGQEVDRTRARLRRSRAVGLGRLFLEPPAQLNRSILPIYFESPFLSWVHLMGRSWPGEQQPKPNFTSGFPSTFQHAYSVGALADDGRSCPRSIAGYLLPFFQ